MKKLIAFAVTACVALVGASAGTRRLPACSRLPEPVDNMLVKIRKAV